MYASVKVYLGLVTHHEQLLEQSFTLTAIETLAVTANAAWYVGSELIEELDTERRTHVQEHVLHNNVSAQWTRSK